MAAGYATAMDNFWPTPGDVQARPGYTSHATGFVGTVKTLACWRSATGSEKLFGINDSGAFDVTSAGAIGAVSKTLTDGKCIPLSYTTTGGSFLFLVNGVDSVCYYDGMTWTSTASYAISGGGTLTSSNIVNISAFKRQLFFIEKDSMSFFYLPVDTITGTVYRYPMGAIFTKGGYLTAASTWTIDGGEGMDDYCVFATSRGQLAVFRGTDPSSASTWSLQGVYDLGEPLGKRCFLRYSGDLLPLQRRPAAPVSRPPVHQDHEPASRLRHHRPDLRQLRILLRRELRLAGHRLPDRRPPAHQHPDDQLHSLRPVCDEH